MSIAVTPCESSSIGAGPFCRVVVEGDDAAAAAVVATAATAVTRVSSSAHASSPSSCAPLVTSRGLEPGQHRRQLQLVRLPEEKHNLEKSLKNKKVGEAVVPGLQSLQPSKPLANMAAKVY